MAQEIYKVLSPDGITLEFNKNYTSMKNCVLAFYKWRKRFEKQGYYSTVARQIDLRLLSDYCEVQKFVKGEWIYWADLSEMIEHLRMKF